MISKSYVILSGLFLCSNLFSYGQNTTLYSLFSAQQSLFDQAALYRAYLEEEAIIIAGGSSRQQWVESGLSPRTHQIYANYLLDYDRERPNFKPSFGFNLLSDNFGPTSLRSIRGRFGLMFGDIREKSRGEDTNFWDGDNPYGIYLVASSGANWIDIDGSQLTFIDPIENPINQINGSRKGFFNIGLSYFYKHNPNKYYENILFIGGGWNTYSSMDQRGYEIQTEQNRLFLNFSDQYSLWAGYSWELKSKNNEVNKTIFHSVNARINWQNGSPTDVALGYRHSFSKWWVGVGGSMHWRTYKNIGTSTGAHFASNLNVGVDLPIEYSKVAGRKQFYKLRFFTAIELPSGQLLEYFGINYEVGFIFLMNYERR